MTPAEDLRIETVVDSSILGRASDRWAEALRAARSSSWFVRLASPVIERWTAAPWPVRRKAVGFILVIAPAVHLAMSAASPRSEPGWLWLIIPGLSAAIGALFVLASGIAGGDPTSH